MSVLVCGDIMLDKYINGAVNRISPEAPVPVVHVKNEYGVIGGCGNVANGIKALGVATDLLSVIGKDIHGRELTSIVKEKSITDLLIAHSLPTITKVRVVSNKHQLLRYDFEEIQEPVQGVQKKIIAAISANKSKVVVLSDYGKGFCTPQITQALIDQSKKNKSKVLVDPKNKNWDKYKGAYLISPNFKEFCEALNKRIENEDKLIEQYAKDLMKQYQIENILVTRSQKGMSLITPAKSFHIPTFAKEVYDVTGAGDTVIGTIAAMLHKGKSLAEAVYIANVAAGIAVAHFGTYAVSEKELKLALKNK
jgi:D-glycero-beta-D-manno-heptose-7-phosphate kinase